MPAPKVPHPPTPLDALPAVPDRPPPEVLDAEVLDAELVDDAEALDAEVLDAEPVDDVADMAEALADAEVESFVDAELVEEAPPPAPLPVAPPPTPRVDPAPAPVAKLPQEPVAALFALDAAGPGSPSPVEPVIPAEHSRPPVLDDGLFPLDADAAAPEVLALDLVAPTPARAAPRPPKPPPAPVVPESPTAERTVTKPAKNGRPVLKITYVLPGEQSPLGG